MSKIADRFWTSILSGIAVTAVGICLVCIPLVIQQSVTPYGVLVGWLDIMGNILSFLLLDLVIEHPPMTLCFFLAIVTWSSLIFGFRTFISRHKEHHQTKL